MKQIENLPLFEVIYYPDFITTALSFKILNLEQNRDFADVNKFNAFRSTARLLWEFVILEITRSVPIYDNH